MKVVLRASAGIIALSIVACSQGVEEKKPAQAATAAKFRNSEKSKLQFHGDMDTSSTPVSSLVLESLKNNHLEVSSTKTIGEAFDTYKYATKKQWRETASQRGPYFIDYICWIDVSPVSTVAIKEGVVKRELVIKFVIYEGGDTSIAMVSRVDTKSDGMLQTTIIKPADIKKIVTAIYENREIAF